MRDSSSQVCQAMTATMAKPLISVIGHTPRTTATSSAITEMFRTISRAISSRRSGLSGSRASALLKCADQMTIALVAAPSSVTCTISQTEAGRLRCSSAMTTAAASHASTRLPVPRCQRARVISSPPGSPVTSRNTTMAATFSAPPTCHVQGTSRRSPSTSLANKDTCSRMKAAHIDQWYGIGRRTTAGR